jgi:hypothetical protein
MRVTTWAIAAAIAAAFGFLSGLRWPYHQPRPPEFSAMNLLFASIQVTLRCVVREQGLRLLIRLSGLLMLCVLASWFTAHLLSPSAKAMALATVMGMSALGISGLGVQFSRRRGSCSKWVRTLPCPLSTWWVSDVLALGLLGLLLTLPLAGFIVLQGVLPAVVTLGLLAGNLVLLAVLSLLVCADPKASFAWSVLVWMGWMALTNAALSWCNS